MVKASRNFPNQPQRPAIFEVISSNDPTALLSLLYSTTTKGATLFPASTSTNNSNNVSSTLSRLSTNRSDPFHSSSNSDAATLVSNVKRGSHINGDARLVKFDVNSGTLNSVTTTISTTAMLSLASSPTDGRGSNVLTLKSAPATNIDVNVRDNLGMTPLHHAVNKNNLHLVRLLLEHPKIDVNMKDLESGWTALHRALYHGYLRIALALLAHKGIDSTIEDKDRNVATDLYLASTSSTLPQAPCPGDALFTWGSNSNFTLGHNDGDDRAIPELVKFPYQTSTISFPGAKAAKSQIYNIAMEKFHTTVATSESGLAVKIWGYGSGGRLGGTDRKMLSQPTPVYGFSGQAALTALGRDHTVIVTKKGEVYTFGNNKYGQLGYAVDVPKIGQDPVQMTPKKVSQGIVKVRVTGAAASKWHTVVHSETELYTWGFNYGQLGYERKGDIQLFPRKVVSIPSGRLIMQVATSDSATACLLSSNEVIVYYNFGYHRVIFPLFPYADSFKDNYHTVMNGNRPTSITSCDNKFGALTGWGDVFVWQYPEVDADITLGSLASTATSISTISTPGSSGGNTHFSPEPRRVWVYGGDRTQAVDFAVGQNGSIILLTKGGHVYIGTNRGSSIGRNVKWRRVQHLDRVVQVQANSSGAWAAVRSEVPLKPISIRPSTLGRDLERALSLNMLYHANEGHHRQDDDCHNKNNTGNKDSDENEDVEFEEDPDIWRMDFSSWRQMTKLWDDIVMKQPSHQETPIRFSLSHPVGHSPPYHHLFDVDIQCGTRVIGAHRIVLAARSPILRRAFVDTPKSESKLGMLVSVKPIFDQQQHSSRSNHRLYRIKLHQDIEFATAALLVQFLYSDRIDPFWDALRLQADEKAYALKVRQQLYHLALELALPSLQAALQYSFTHRCQPSMSGNLGLVFDDPRMFKGLEDVAILLADGAMILSHQIVLAQRSPVFYSMLAQTDVWTRERQTPRQLIVGQERDNVRLLELDMKHVDLETMRFVMQFIYTDCGPEMFDSIEKEEMVELIQVIVNVLQVADELMLYRLKDICEYILGQQVRPKTLVSLLEIADIFSATALKQVCLDYLCQNLESALDQRWLVGLDDTLLKLIEETLITRLEANSPFVRTGGHLPADHDVEDMRQVLKKRAAFEALMAMRDAEVEAARSRKAPPTAEGLAQSPAPQRRGLESPVTSPWTTVSGRSDVSSKDETILSPRMVGSSSVPSRILTDATNRKDDSGLTGRPRLASEWPDLSLIGDASATPAGLIRSSSFQPPAPSSFHAQPDSPLQSISPIVKKKGWGIVSPGIQDAEKLSTGIVSADHQSPGSKPSLRDILQQEQRQQQHQQSTPSLSGGSLGALKDKTAKLSQKERRRLQQQHATAALAESAAATSPNPAPQAWGKIATPSTVSSARGSDATLFNRSNGQIPAAVPNHGYNYGSSQANGRHSPSVPKASPSYIFDPSPQALVALLEAQAQDLLRLSGGQAAIARLSDTSSRRGSHVNGKPITVTASSPAVGGNGPMKASTFSGPSTGTTAAKEAPWRRDAIPEPLWSISSPKDGVGAPTANGVGSPSISSSSSAPAFAGASFSPSLSSRSSSLSTFALIQNQQLRDRNQLLQTRQRKKPLYQIQVEEQAVAQLRTQALNSIRNGTAVGTGEWFTCELGSSV